MERPVDFVSACSAMTVDGLGLCAALGFGNHDTEVSAAPGAGAGKVDGHTFNLTLPVSPFKSAFSSVAWRWDRQGRVNARPDCKLVRSEWAQALAEHHERRSVLPPIK